MSLPQTVYFSISNFGYKLTQPTIQYVFVSYSPLCLLSLYSWLYLCSCFVPLSVSCLFAPQCFLFCFCVSVYVLSVFSVLSLVSVLLTVSCLCLSVYLLSVCSFLCLLLVLSLCSSLSLVSVLFTVSCLCLSVYLLSVCSFLRLLLVLSLCSSRSLVPVLLTVSCLCLSVYLLSLCSSLRLSQCYYLLATPCTWCRQSPLLTVPKKPWPSSSPSSSSDRGSCHESAVSSTSHLLPVNIMVGISYKTFNH